ncbi:16865_t:CDS:1 [Entrophospora sp. SA101]|nr:16865_t:CDS:1 [Entrophospora sp. SA101]
MNFGGGDSGNSNGLPNFNSMEQVLNNPAFMQYISQLMQDPQFIDNVIAMNPQLGEMAPQLRQLSRGPEFQSLLSNPEAIRHMATLMGNNPGGFGITTPNKTTKNHLLPLVKHTFSFTDEEQGAFIESIFNLLEKALNEFLIENEHMIPSTVAKIFASKHHINPDFDNADA